MLELFLLSYLQQYGLSPFVSDVLVLAAAVVGICCLAFVVSMMIRKVLVRLIHRLVVSTKLEWDDLLLEYKVISRLTWFVPVLLVSILSSLLLEPASSTAALFAKGVRVGYILVIIRFVHSLLAFINAYYKQVRHISGSPYQGYTDAAVVIAYFIGAISIASILTGKSIIGVVSVLGGLTAVTMLVFKDTLLNFAASIQLNTTDMVRVGDWIEMEKYGADGDVIQTSLNTVRVQNWDKTITTIPTYALVASSFKNWRGMAQSGGRRIKRSLYLDQTSVKFCSTDLLEKFEQVEILQDYLIEKTAEIESHNYLHKIDTGTSVLNGRRHTNLGLFRAYVKAYLEHHPMLNKSMTFLVRHRPPGANGLPLEIYVFSKDKVWANYEAIQADIFDHFFAAVPEFELRIFQQPSGADLRCLAQQI